MVARCWPATAGSAATPEPKTANESLASERDGARYEETTAANAERHGSPESLACVRRIRERRALPGGTDTLGFALLVLRRR